MAKRKALENGASLPSWKSIVECPKCDQPFSEVGKIPRILQCGHTVCQECLYLQIHENKARCHFGCPETQITRGIEGLGVNHPVLRLRAMLLERIQAQACSCYECQSKPASIHCIDCTVSLCEECCATTHSSRILSGHNLAPLSEIVLFGKDNCTTHRRHSLDFWCSDCNTAICLLCKDYGDHSGHKCELLQSAAAKERELTKKSVIQASHEANQLQHKSGNAFKTISLLEEQKSEISHCIKDHFLRLKSALMAACDSREAELLAECNESAHRKIVTLQQHRTTMAWHVACASLNNEIAKRLELMEDLPFMVAKSMAKPHLKALEQQAIGVGNMSVDNLKLHISDGFIAKGVAAIKSHCRFLGPSPPEISQVKSENGKIALNWPESAAVNGYEIEIQPISENMQKFVSIFCGKENSTSFDAKFDSYNVRGRSRDDSGWGEWSSLVRCFAAAPTSLVFPLTEKMEGILFYIGTKKGTQAWTNPATSGQVFPTRNTCGTGLSSSICDRGLNAGTTASRSLSWWMIDLRSYMIKPNAYSLWIHADNAQLAPRNWKFEASNDGLIWDVLSTHSNDTTLSISKLSASFVFPPLSGPPKFYRIFRILQTGTNQSGSHTLTCAGLEIYGEVSII